MDIRVKSATASVLRFGVEINFILFLINFKSILSKPVPALPKSSSLVALFKSSLSTLVVLLMIMILKFFYFLIISFLFKFNFTHIKLFLKF